MEFEHQHTIERHTYTHLLNFTRPKEQQFLRLLLAVNSWAFSLTFSFKRNMSAKFKYDYPIFLRLDVTEKGTFIDCIKQLRKCAKQLLLTLYSSKKDVLCYLHPKTLISNTFQKSLIFMMPWAIIFLTNNFFFMPMILREPAGNTIVFMQSKSHNLFNLTGFQVSVNFQVNKKYYYYYTESSYLA